MEEINSFLAVIRKKGEEYAWNDPKKPKKKTEGTKPRENKHQKDRRGDKRRDNQSQFKGKGFKGNKPEHKKEVQKKEEKPLKKEEKSHRKDQERTHSKEEKAYKKQEKGQKREEETRNKEEKNQKKEVQKKEQKPVKKEERPKKDFSQMNTDGIEIKQDRYSYQNKGRKDKGYKKENRGNKNNYRGKKESRGQLVEVDFTAGAVQPKKETVTREVGVLSVLKTDSEVVPQKEVVVEKQTRKVETPKKQPEEPKFTQKEWIQRWTASLARVNTSEVCFEGVKKEIQERATPDTQSFSERRTESQPEQGYPTYNNQGFHPHPYAYPPQYEAYPGQPQMVYYQMVPPQAHQMDKDKMSHYAYGYPQYPHPYAHPEMAEMDPKKMAYMPKQPDYGNTFYQGK